MIFFLSMSSLRHGLSFLKIFRKNHCSKSIDQLHLKSTLDPWEQGSHTSGKKFFKTQEKGTFILDFLKKGQEKGENKNKNYESFNDLDMLIGFFIEPTDPVKIGFFGMWKVPQST